MINCFLNTNLYHSRILYFIMNTVNDSRSTILLGRLTSTTKFHTSSVIQKTKKTALEKMITFLKRNLETAQNDIDNQRKNFETAFASENTAQFKKSENEMNQTVKFFSSKLYKRCNPNDKKIEQF